MPSKLFSDQRIAEVYLDKLRKSGKYNMTMITREIRYRVTATGHKPSKTKRK